MPRRDEHERPGLIHVLRGERLLCQSLRDGRLLQRFLSPWNMARDRGLKIRDNAAALAAARIGRLCEEIGSVRSLKAVECMVRVELDAGERCRPLGQFGRMECGCFELRCDLGSQVLRGTETRRAKHEPAYHYERSDRKH